MKQTLVQPTIYSFSRKDVGRIILFRNEVDEALYPFQIILNTNREDDFDDEILLKDVLAEHHDKDITYTIGELVGVMRYDYVKIENEYEERPVNQLFERRGDMGQEVLQAIIQDDGDVCISIHNSARDFREFSKIGMEFCTIGSGGGKSPHTLRALQELVLAMARDEKGVPL